MVRRSFLAILLVLVLTQPQSSRALPKEIPRFQLGFKTLAGLIPEEVGDPLENEHHNPLNGDGLQTTTGGLLVWRKADNWTAFTNGWRTWVNGPLGLQERGNQERFGWETETERVEAVEGRPADLVTTGWAVAAAPAGLVGAGVIDRTPSSPTPGFETTGALAATGAAQVAESATPVFLPGATASPFPSAVPSATVPAGGIVSPDPAGEWVTSTYPAARYYTSRYNVSRWQSWAADNRIWFGSETALLAAYPGRVRDDPAATSTSRAVTTAASTVVPSAAPTRTSTPAATATSTARRTVTTAAGGICSTTPAGDWVTSTYPTTQYYTTREKETVWMAWAGTNRIWFQTEAALLSAYPGRIRR